jgi:hypothetical protein
MPAVVDVCRMEGTIYSAKQRSGSPYRNAQIEEALFQMFRCPVRRRNITRSDGGLQSTKPLQLSRNRAAGSGVQLSVRRVEDNCCIALIF